MCIESEVEVILLSTILNFKLNLGHYGNSIKIEVIYDNGDVQTFIHKRTVRAWLEKLPKPQLIDLLFNLVDNAMEV